MVSGEWMSKNQYVVLNNVDRIYKVIWNARIVTPSISIEGVTRAVISINRRGFR
jgi:hypothetical protein